MAAEGKSYRFRDLRFWAESGMICIEDVKTGEFDVVMVREFLLRAKAINDSIGRLRYSDERNEHQDFVEHAVESCRHAQKQGRPDDPKAVADMIRHKRTKTFQSNFSPCVETRYDEAHKEIPKILGPDGLPFFRTEEERRGDK